MDPQSTKRSRRDNNDSRYVIQMGQLAYPPPPKIHQQPTWEEAKAIYSYLKQFLVYEDDDDKNDGDDDLCIQQLSPAKRQRLDLDFTSAVFYL